MIKVRLIFEKTAPSHYLSHLDLMTVFARACVRAGLALHFSNGYNPHPYLSAACPLPVGVSGLAEVLDIGLDEGSETAALAERLNNTLPVGLRILRAYPALAKPTMIHWGTYDLTFRYDAAISPDRFERMNAFFRQSPLLMEKTSKGQSKTVDISELIHSLTWTRDGRTVRASAFLATGARSLNVLRLSPLLPEDLRPCEAEAVRVSLLNERLEPFV